MRQLEFVECYSVRDSNRRVLYPESWMYRRQAAYGILIKHGQILLMRIKSSGLFWLPGGGVDSEETLKEACHREFLEETGIAVRVGKHLGGFERPFCYDPLHSDIFDVFWNEAHIFRCEADDTHLLADDEVDDLEGEKPRWYPIESITEEIFQHADSNLSRMVMQEIGHALTTS